MLDLVSWTVFLGMALLGYKGACLQRFVLAVLCLAVIGVLVLLGLLSLLTSLGLACCVLGFACWSCLPSGLAVLLISCNQVCLVVI